MCVCGFYTAYSIGGSLAEWKKSELARYLTAGGLVNITAATATPLLLLPVFIPCTGQPYLLTESAREVMQSPPSVCPSVCVHSTVGTD